MDQSSRIGQHASRHIRRCRYGAKSKCLNGAGGSIAYIPSMTVGVSARRMETGISSFMEYLNFLSRTLMLHRKCSHASLACLVYVPAAIAMHSIGLVVIRELEVQKVISKSSWLTKTKDCKLLTLFSSSYETKMRFTEFT